MKHKITLISIIGIFIFAIIILSNENSEETTISKKSHQSLPVFDEEWVAKENIYVPTGSTPEYKWKENDYAIFKYNYNLLSENLKINSNSEKSVSQLDVGGDLHVRLLKIQGNNVYLGMQLHNVVIDSQQENKTPLDFGLIIALMDKQGKIKDYYLPKKMHREAAKFVKQMLDIQVVLPKLGNESSVEWKTSETDQVGSYIAEYQFNIDKAIVTKDKLKYIDINKSNLEQFRIIKAHSKAKLGRFWLANYSKDESWQYDIPNTKGSSFSESISLKFSSSEPDKSLLLGQIPNDYTLEQVIVEAQTQDVSDQLAKSNESRLEQERRIAEQKYQNTPFNEVLDNMMQAVASAKSHADTLESINNMRLWLLANPHLASTIYESLRADSSGEISADVSARMIHALELASDTPDVQAALGLIVADNNLNWEQRLQAAIASGGVGEIKDDSLKQALWETALAAPSRENAEQSQVSDSSLYALGILAERDETIAHSIQQELVPRLNIEQLDDPESISVALRTLVNGDIVTSEALSKASQLATDYPFESVRATALTYLNTDNSGQYTPVILNALSDSSQDVRVTAVRELKNANTMDLGVVNALGEKLLHEADKAVVGEIIVALGEYKEVFPEARNYLDSQKGKFDSDLEILLEKALQ